MNVSRREFLVTAPAVGAALALMPSLAIPRGPQSPGGCYPPVVSFHLDQPYLDFTGLEKPYVPPAGLRSGAPLAGLSEQEMLSRFYGFI